MKRHLYLLIVVFTVFGCSSTIKNMVPEASPVAYSQTGKSVKIGTVFAGLEEIAGERIKVNPEKFRGALILALQESVIYTVETSDEDTDYRLDVLMFKTEYPSWGFDMTVQLGIAYSLFDETTGEIVLEEDIYNNYTEGFFSCCIGAVRLRKAEEGAVRENIGLALDKLSAFEKQKASP